MKSLRPAAALAIALLSLSACKTSELGQCQSTADCLKGAVCDTTQSPAVCVVPPGGCFPACADGLACKDGTCSAPGCNPACSATQTCDLATSTCHDVTSAEISLTSPAAGTFAGHALQATASARAPGAGITAVRIEVRRGGTALVTQSAAAAPTSGDPANWAASLSLTGVSDGAATLVAVGTWAQGTVESTPLAITVDQTVPTLVMLSDGRTALLAGGATATVSVQISDGTGAGAIGTDATLTLTGITHAPYTATVSAAGSATFSLLLDDALAPPQTARTLSFSIAATDKVGNTASLSGDAKEVIRIDRLAPTGTVIASSAWHSQLDLVTLAGTISDSGGGIVGGQSGVAIFKDANQIATAILTPGANQTAGTWTATVDLATQAFAADSEAAWPFTVRLTDQLGNQGTISGSLNVDNEAPRITGIALGAAADFTDLSGRGFYKTDAGSIPVTASIADSSGAADGGVCLRIAGESAACPHLGTSSDGGFWSFLMPRPGAASTLDGTTPLNFTISAADGVAALPDGGLLASHQATSAPQPVYYDNVGPAIAVAPDSTWYARTAPGGAANVLSVPVTITDTVGVALDGGQPSIRVKGGAPAQYASKSGNVFSFNVDPAALTAGTEGPLDFSVTARDVLGNTLSASGARNVDDKAPVASLKIYRDAPGAGTIAYPSAIASTGWDGGVFLYSDTVHISGTLSDDGGLSGSSLNVRVDGTQLDGGTSVGVPHSFSCSAGSTTCNFDVPLALNAQGNGTFYTTGTVLPAGPMQIVVTAEDSAVLADGGAARHGLDAGTPVSVTRFWWSYDVPGMTNIDGLALHPNGDVIVTGETTTGADTVAAIFNDGTVPASGTTPKSALHWSFGRDAGVGVNGDAGLGNVDDAPAIGSGNANTAPVYLAATSGTVVALSGAGVPLWLVKNLDPFETAPLVAPATVSTGLGPSNVEEVIIPSFNGPASQLYGIYLDPSVAGPPILVQINSPAQDGISPPLLLNGTIFYATDRGITKTGFADGGFGAISETLTTQGPFWSVVTDGTRLYANRVNRPDVFQVDSALDAGFSATLQGNSGADMSLDLNGHLLAGDKLGHLNQVDTADGGVSNFATISNTMLGALVGADGTVYALRTLGFLRAYVNGQKAWDLDPTGTVYRTPVLDCQGHLYIASGTATGPGTVWAIIADDKGLGDSPWPVYRRDSRNTGNAGGLKYGIRTLSGCVQ